MRRRRLLNLSGVISLGFLAGCMNDEGSSTGVTSEEGDAGNGESTDESTLESSHTKNDGSTVASDASGEPTVQPTTTVNTRVLESGSFGEWLSTDKWGLTFSDFTLYDFDSFYDTWQKDKRVEMHRDVKMVKLLGTIKNISPEKKAVVFGDLGVIHKGEIYPVQGSFEHPEYDDRVDLDWTRWSENHSRTRFSMLIHGGNQIQPGEKRKFYSVAMIPAPVDSNRIGAAYGLFDFKQIYRWR